METALRETGTCGRFQVYHVIFTQLPRFVAVWGILIMMFGSHDPGWRCKDYVETSGISIVNDSGRNVVGGYDVVNETFSSSPVRITLLESLQNKTNIRKNNGHVGGANFRQGERLHNGSFLKTTKSTSNVYNETCDVIKWCGDLEFNPASITIVSEFELVCERKWILRAILLIMSVGYLTGALVGGQIGEKFGRKVSLFGGCFVTFVFSTIAIFSTHWVMYSVCLFFMGAGGISLLSTSVLFSMEYLNSKWRGIFSSVPTWDISLCIFTFATAVMKSWVHVHIVTSAVCFLGSMGYFFVSESARWLVVQERYDEAHRVIQNMARINRKPPPSDESLWRLKEETRSSSEKSSAKSRPKTYSYRHLFKSKYLRDLSIKFNIIFLVLFGTYLSLSFGIDSLPGNFYINVVASSVCEICIVVITGLICKKYGRRWGGFATSFLGAISSACIVVALYLSDGEVQTTTVKACAYIARSCSQAMGVVAMIFMVELYPTAVRNVAFGMVHTMSGIGGIIAPFLIPEPARDSFAVCFSIMSVAYLINLWIFLSLPETNKLSLVDRIGDTPKNRVVEEECM